MLVDINSIRELDYVRTNGALTIGATARDIAVERDNFRFYFPLGTSILISVLLSLVVWLFRR